MEKSLPIYLYFKVYLFIFIKFIYAMRPCAFFGLLFMALPLLPLSYFQNLFLMLP